MCVSPPAPHSVCSSTDGPSANAGRAGAVASSLSSAKRFAPPQRGPTADAKEFTFALCAGIKALALAAARPRPPPRPRLLGGMAENAG